MPPRFVYWTILIDNQPTAFRAARQEDLLPTLRQLQRKSTNVVMKWFARGKVWDSPEAELAAKQRPKPPMEKRGRDWRPGGAHKDPRDRFKKKNRPERAWSDKPDLRADREKLGPPREARPWTPKPPGPTRRDRPWSGKPPRGDKRAWSGKPAKPSGDRPWQTKPTGPRAQRRPWQGKPLGGAQGKPAGPGGPRKPWQGKNSTSGRKPFRPHTGPTQSWPRKKRDDEPPEHS